MVLQLPSFVRYNVSVSSSSNDLLSFSGRQYVPAAPVSWRASDDSGFVTTEPSPAMFHMDVGESSLYDHVVERPQFGSIHYTPNMRVTPQHSLQQAKGTTWSSNIPQSSTRNTHNRLARKQAGHK